MLSLSVLCSCILKHDAVCVLFVDHNRAQQLLDISILSVLCLHLESIIEKSQLYKAQGSTKAFKLNTNGPLYPSNWVQETCFNVVINAAQLLD